MNSENGNGREGGGTNSALVVVIVVLLVAIGVGAAIVISGKDSETAGTTAKANVTVDGGKAGKKAKKDAEQASSSGEEKEVEEIEATVNGKLGVEESSIETVKIEGDEATATLASGGEIPLRKEAGRWVPQVSAPEARQLELEGPQAQQPEVEKPEAAQPEVEVQQPSTPEAQTPGGPPSK